MAHRCENADSSYTATLSHQHTCAITSNAPVPVVLGRPRTMLPDGVVSSSKSPCSAASDKKLAVVSYDAFSSGDECVAMPLRLNGLYPPSNVYCPSAGCSDAECAQGRTM
jgi:hypothetical protein